MFSVTAKPQVIHDNCTEEPTVAAVVGVNSRPKSRWRPVALETVELEKLASRKLHMSAKTTMKIAEKLYTQGWGQFVAFSRCFVFLILTAKTEAIKSSSLIKGFFFEVFIK